MIKPCFFILLLLFLQSCKGNVPDSQPELSFPNAADTTGSLSKEKDSLRDLFAIHTPKENQVVTSPLLMEGKARGYWFFEADAMVELLDEDLSSLGKSYISAVGDWMTEDWVAFKGTLEFKEPTTQKGFLIFHKANPSGLEEYELSDTLQVHFAN